MTDRRDRIADASLAQNDLRFDEIVRLQESGVPEPIDELHQTLFDAGEIIIARDAKLKADPC
jgi:hypothetical protein